MRSTAVWRPIVTSLALLGLLVARPLRPLEAQEVSIPRHRPTLSTFDTVPGFIWAGSDSLLTLERLAAYAAPVLWFSPDEPNLDGKTGKDIRIPEAFPFEQSPDSPVAYYMVRTVIVKESAAGWAFQAAGNDRTRGTVNLAHLDAVDMDYFFYYSTERGLGGHKHDVESVQAKLVILRQPECRGCEYALFVPKVVGRAHGMLWYDNTLVVDQGTRFPLRILVEEGKHASCTDKNADGYYTPGFDVNRRINDAWGVRDIISGGALFSGGWQSWMAKVRQDPDQVLPPLPEDSPLRASLSVGGVYAPNNAVYELRPFPPASRAEPDLQHFIADKGDPGWPEIISYGESRYHHWLEDQSFSRSLSIAYRYDGQSGVAAAFPLFIVKNYNVELTGGWLVNRVYFEKDRWAWMLMYTPSASRWVDSYVSGGLEWVDVPNGASNVAYFVGELGVKFRANMQHSPAKFLAKLTDFWGVRAGIQATGGFEIGQLNYVLEIGAGTF
jgi:hypothetical protein